MKLIALGGSAAGVNTGQGSSGYFVETGATRLVLDLGPGTLTELRRHTDYRTLHAVVLSHLHVDHVLDIIALRFALAYNPVKPPSRIPLWLPPGGLAFLDRAAATFAQPSKEDDFFPEVFDVAEFDPDSSLKIGDATLTFAPTVHYVPCWAIRLRSATGERDLLYTADTGPAADLTQFAADSGVIIAEAALLEPSTEPFDQRGHLTAAEAADLANAANANTLILTHLWEELGFDAYRAQAASTFTGRLEIAHPGLTITW